MSKGPVLNDISKRFTSRDTLGIEGVATSISADVCPVVTTVTPRAFYWPFMVWIYHDFIEYSGLEKTDDNFNSYVKRQDYFFVLATLLNEDSDQTYLVGTRQCTKDLENNPDGPYQFNNDYFKSNYGGMLYYNSGCFEMNFVYNRNPETGEFYKFPKIHSIGTEMGKNFERVIEHTEYYKNYRLKDDPVPKHVLEEYGRAIHFGLKGFDECKAQLRRALFDRKKFASLSDCASYLVFLKKAYGIDWLDKRSCRQIFYDYQCPDGRSITIPDELSQIAQKWELIVGRQYFAVGLEIIWTCMINNLSEPLTLGQWIKKAINVSDFNWNLDVSVDEVLEECNVGFEERESLIRDSENMENGLKIILSIYNRFRDKEYFDELDEFLERGQNAAISYNCMFGIIEQYKDKSLLQLLKYIIKNWIVDQHYRTAFEKMLQGRDGFYFEIIDNLYVKKNDYKMDFKGIRMIQLMQVMKDLDML